MNNIRVYRASCRMFVLYTCTITEGRKSERLLYTPTPEVNTNDIVFGTDVHESE